MRILSLLLLFVALVARPASCDEADRLAELVKLRGSGSHKALESADGLVFGDSERFKKLVMRRRGWHTIVLFTMFNNADCAMCATLNPAFQRVAESYALAHPNNDPAVPSANVFFMLVDYTKASEIFYSHPNLTSVPVMAYYPPGRRMKDAPSKNEYGTRWMTPLHPDNVMPIGQGPDANAVLDWVHKKIGEQGPKVTIYESPWPFIQQLIVLLVSIGGMLYMANRLMGPKKLAMGISLLITFYIFSGSMWCLLRGAQWAGMQDRGRVEYIHPWGNQQHMAEGMIVGALNFAGGLSLVALTAVVPKLSGTTQRAAGVGLALLAGLCFRGILSTYKFKNRNYGVYSQ